MKPRYLSLFEDGTLEKRVQTLKSMTAPCRLCPRLCGVDRDAGERGFCRLSNELVMSHALPHFGEEPPISGTHGAGTLFFSSCNLGCLFCQNYQISRERMGKRIDAHDLAGIMKDLQERHCHNVEAVTPTPQLPGIIEALGYACEMGLAVPFVYNCGGYERTEIIRQLDGIVDIYLPDFKYGADADAYAWSGVKDYTAHALASIREMMRQVGAAIETDGAAAAGIIVRHLVLPGGVTNSLNALKLIQTHLSTSLPLSLMAQYTPTPAVKGHPVLGRQITRREYERVVEAALDRGFETVFVQDMDDESALMPDFAKDTPFTWES
jgi:putative pyruvate formate lyase activating enzyme